MLEISEIRSTVPVPLEKIDRTAGCRKKLIGTTLKRELLWNCSGKVKWY